MHVKPYAYRAYSFKSVVTASRPIGLCSFCSLFMQVNIGLLRALRHTFDLRCIFFLRGRSRPTGLVFFSTRSLKFTVPFHLANSSLLDSVFSYLSEFSIRLQFFKLQFNLKWSTDGWYLLTHKLESSRFVRLDVMIMWQKTTLLSVFFCLGKLFAGVGDRVVLF